MKKYVIGIDYGSLSARAVLLDTDDGRELAIGEYVYSHGIMTEKEIANKEPELTTALQHPDDYIEALKVTVGEVLSRSGVPRESVVGICIDATASTVIPYLDSGAPLTSLDEFKANPEAYIKLWKHHGAEPYAEKMTAAAVERGEEWLSEYGGTVSGEWLYPKIVETARKSPDVYARAAVFGEAAEWLTELLTGERIKSSALAGYKALWSEERGYPSAEYFAEACPDLTDLKNKIPERILPLGAAAGFVNQRGESLTGLAEGTVVATPAIDAHASLPSAKMTHGGDLMIIFGTSACHILLSEKKAAIEGICGRVRGGVLPGLYAYESGQTAVGDMLGWFVDNCLSSLYTASAEAEGISPFEYLNRLAESLEVGKSGLIALDWWNGNRSPYVDYDLSGLILGLNMKTRPEEIYHALISSIAFGARQLLELYRCGGVEVSRIVAAGGISKKNRFFMQTMADVLGEEIFIADTNQAAAKGSAIYAAVAAGCYPTVSAAAEAMGDEPLTSFKPRAELTAKYDELYKIYRELSDHFANSDVMKRLRSMNVELD